MEPFEAEIAEIICAWCFEDEHMEVTKGEKDKAAMAAKNIFRRMKEIGYAQSRKSSVE